MITDWPTIRAQFPVLKEWAYLNTATFGPLPTCAVEAAANHFRRRDREACLDFLDWYTDADAVRAQAAELIGAEPDDVAFIPNTATALSWVVNGIRWTPGDHVVTLPHEFPNNEYFARVLEQRGIKYTQAALPDGLFSMDKFLAEITERTRLVILSSVELFDRPSSAAEGNRPRAPRAQRIVLSGRHAGRRGAQDGRQNGSARRARRARLQVAAVSPGDRLRLRSPASAGMAATESL